MADANETNLQSIISALFNVAQRVSRYSLHYIAGPERYMSTGSIHRRFSLHVRLPSLLLHPYPSYERKCFLIKSYSWPETEMFNTGLSGMTLLSRSVRQLYTSQIRRQSTFPYPAQPNPTPHQIFHLPPNAPQEAIKTRCM